MRELLKENLFTSGKRKLVIGATDSNTGKLKRFDETSSREELIDAIVASAAVPAVFPYE